MSNAKIIITGAIDEGTAYIPAALNFLKMVRSAGVDSINKSFPAGDGAIIRVVLDPHAGDKVYINPPKCPVVKFSGLIDTFKAKIRPPGHTPRYLINKQVAEEMRTEQSPNKPAALMAGVRPIKYVDEATLVSGLTGSGVPDPTHGIDGDFYTQTLGSAAPTIYIKSGGAWLPHTQDKEKAPFLTTKLPVEATVNETENMYGEALDIPFVSVAYSTFKERLEALMPSRFTGHIRKVIQATFATDAWVNFSETMAPGGIIKPPAAPVDYRFGNSWGCIRSKGAYHFIQITLGFVYSVPAKYCVHKEKSVTGAPVDVDVVILHSLDLKNKVSLGPLPEGLGSSWDQEIGWAFSYDKPEASIILNGTTQVGQDSYVTVSLITISFVFNQAGVLSSIVSKVSNPEILFLPAFMSKSFDTGGHAYFNKITKTDEVVVNHTVDFGLQRLGQTVPNGYSVSHIPVYVFYTDKGMQLCTYTYVPVAAQSKTTTWPPVRPCKVLNPNLGTYTYFDDATDKVNQGTAGTRTATPTTTWGFACNEAGLISSVGSETSSITSIKLGAEMGLEGGFPAAYGSCDLIYSSQSRNIVTGEWGPSGTQRLTVVTASNSTPLLETWYVTDDVVGGGISANSALTLSTTDKEAVLLYVSQTRAARTATKTTYVNNSAVPDAGNTQYYCVSSSAGLRGTLDAAASAYFYGVVCGPGYPAYCGDSTDFRAWINDIPTGVTPTLFDATTGEVLTKAIRLDAASPASTSVVYSYTFALSLSCAGHPSEYASYTANYTTATHSVGSSTVKVSDAQIITSLVVFGHGDRVNIAQGTHTEELTHPTPYSGFPLAWEYSQAAFDPKNTITHKADIWGDLVVKQGDTTYDVKHGLHGWLGVV